jgi:hypothetical protein
MQTVPLSAVPTQRMAITLENQPCSIELRQNGGTLYFSLWVNDTAIVLSHTCRDRSLLLIGLAYTGFAGNFLFIDSAGETDPYWTGLGDRYQLVYLTAAEVP